MCENKDSQEFANLVGISELLGREYVDDDKQWIGSPFEWIKRRPSRSIGAIGEKMVSAWLAMHDFSVQRSPDTEADRIIEGHRVEIKFSTLWKNGTYLFEQIRDQNYEFAIFLGVSPNAAHCWVVPKSDLIRLWKDENKISSQHGGQHGSDTAWARVSPSKKTATDDLVLSPYGNDLAKAIESVARIVGFTPAKLSKVFDGYQ